MGIVIFAGLLAAGLAGALTVLAVRLNRRERPPGWGRPSQVSGNRHVGARCSCGRGWLQFMFRHGYGQVLGCSAYPSCRVIYQVNGQPLPASQLETLLQVR